MLKDQAESVPRTGATIDGLWISNSEPGRRRGLRILQERDRRFRRQAMLAAQMQKSADEAVAALSIIRAARPVAVVGKKLEH